MLDANEPPIRTKNPARKKHVIGEGVNLHFLSEVILGDATVFIYLPSNVKEYATLSAGAHVDHGVEVETTENHVNRAVDRGCCVST